MENTEYTEYAPPIDLFRLPIPGVDTVEDTDQLARRIIHEWRKTRNEYRPDVLMVDLNMGMDLCRMLKSEGLPVAALPEAESRNRRSDRNRRYPQGYGMSERLGSQSQDGPSVQGASKASKARRQPHSEGKACSMGDGQERTQAPSHLESERDTSRVRKLPIRVLWRKMIAFVFGVRCGSENSLENVKEHAPLSAGASVDHGVDVKTTEDHVNRAADRGCCVSSCSGSSILL